MKKLFLLGAFLLLASTQVFAKAKIPVGTRKVLEKVYDLPDTEEYQKDNSHLDIGRLHEEFNIAYFLPLWVTEEPKLVLIDPKEEDAFDELKQEDMDAILKDNNLDGEKLNKLGFYTRYGGKLVAGLIIAALVWGALGRKNN